MNPVQLSFPPYPLPVLVNNKDEGYILYIKSNGMFENDEFCVVLCDGGDIRHYTSTQIKIFVNRTYGIEKKFNAHEYAEILFGAK